MRSPPDLDTMARYDFAGALPAGITAHPKIDPVTGEMFVFRYDVSAPFLTWAVIGPDGTVTRPPTPVDGVDECYMIHDCAITARYLVIVLGPLQLDVNAMLSGGNPLVWKPELGTRIALIPRDGSPVRWVHGDTFWAWHWANAYDDGDLVHLDFAWSADRGSGSPDPMPLRLTGSFARATLDPATGSIDVHHLDRNALEFPRIDDRLIGRHHRYVTIAGRSTDPPSSSASTTSCTATTRRRHQRPLRRPRRPRRTDLRPPRRRQPTSSTATTSPTPATSTPTAPHCSSSTPPGSPTHPSPRSTSPPRPQRPPRQLVPDQLIGSNNPSRRATAWPRAA